MVIKKSILSPAVLFALFVLGAISFLSPSSALFAATITTSLDGTWQVRIDPDNVGMTDEWFARPLSESGETVPLAVPGVIQQNWPDYHGLAWYERTFGTPDNPNENGRVVLRFWQAEYRADVWLNGVYLGFHEGGEAAFDIDATEAINPERGKSNRLTVRVLNAADTPIDGISMANIPRRNNTNVITPGSGYAAGGLVDSVELLIAPAVRMTDLQLIPNWQTGVIEARATVDNTLPGTISAALTLTAVSTDGGTLVSGDPASQIVIPQGKSTVSSKITIPDFKLWELNDPNLYTVIAKLSVVEFIAPVSNRRDAPSPTLRDVGTDQRTAVCGFRDFRFERGAFRLNGKRIYLKCSHSGSDSPITHRLPLDPDLYRRDILTCKAMGFNMIRYIAGMPRRFQLDLCDRVGFMVYDECLAGWCYARCPERIDRYTSQTIGMIERDRNHPSVVIWGLLNETSDPELVLYAAGLLPLVRKADPDRVVMLNSGSFDPFAGETAKTADYSIWRRPQSPIMPAAIKNCTDQDFVFDGTRWPAGTFCLHPGDCGNEYAALRFTAPIEGKYTVASRFFDVVKDGRATVSIDLFRGDEKIWSGDLNLTSESGSAAYTAELALGAGETLTVVVGIGDETGYGDTTAVDLKITAPDGTLYDVTADYNSEKNPAGVWSYGYLPAGELPDLSAFTLLTLGQERLCFESLGRYANPGETGWGNDLADTHPYKPVPHTAEIIQELRTHQKNGCPVFLSEYGVGSGVDLFRLTRLYEQNHGTDTADAKHYQARLDGFMADWNRWKLDEAFYAPEDFFRQAIARMAEQRRLGINAIRANANVVAHSVTGTHDQGISGEGLTTLWREYKPGTIEVMADLFAPLRFANFAEPVQCRSGSPVHLESVLVNEDILPPGEYPARFIVTGPNNTRVFDQTRTITIPTPPEGEENPMVLPIFDEMISVTGPQGEYHFRVEFEKNAAAGGGDERFFVTDPATLPAVDGPVAVWGDSGLAELLRGMGIDASLLNTNDLSAVSPEGLRIIVGRVPSEEGYGELMKLVENGAHVLFAAPCEAMTKDGNSSALWPLPTKGTFECLPRWLYHKDDWTKNSPFFEGLPCGDVCDYLFYRELIPIVTFNGPELIPDEAIAGAFNTQVGYSAGLSIARWNIGRGQVVISTWRILENLPGHPIADRLLRNMLRAL